MLNLTRNANVVSLLNQAGLTGLRFCGVECRAVEPGDPRSEWQVVDSPAREAPSETEMHLHYIASAYPSVEAATDALRELIAREPVGAAARRAYWDAMREQAAVLFEFLGLV